MDIETYALAKVYTDKTVVGGGAIKGKNCIITEIEDVGNTHIVHFQWTLDDGTVETDTMTVEDGDLVEDSETNGNIKINGVETQVYDDSELQDIVSTDESTVEGNPINFSTLSAQNAKSTILSVEPIQDLHGYDYPWVGGAGKNKLPLTVEKLKSLNSGWNGNQSVSAGITYTILTDDDNNVIGINANGTNNTGGDSTLYIMNDSFSGSYILNGCPSDGSWNTYNISVNIDGTWTTASYDYGSGSNITAISSLKMAIAIRTGQNINKNFYPMLRLSTETDPTFAPYENICPISGRTEIGILGCGKNFITNYQANKSIDGSGQINTDNNTCLSNNISVFPNTTYALSWIKTSDAVVAHCFDENNNYLQYVRLGIVSPQIISTNNLPVGTENIYIQWNKTNEGNVLPTNGQFEISDHRTDYEPYTKSNDLTISLGQTVYGGTLDVENGVLVVDRGIETINGSSTSGWGIDSFGEKLYIPLSTMEKRNGYLGYIKCDKMPTFDNKGMLNDVDYGISAYDSTTLYEGQNWLYLKVSGCSTVAEYQTWIQSNNLQVSYPLATPITINLTPNTINLLKGVNNISVDDANATISLTYRDGSIATLGDLTSAVDNLDSKIDESKILTDTETGTKYRLVVTDGVLGIEEITEPNTLSMSPLASNLVRPTLETLAETNEETPVEETDEAETSDEQEENNTEEE